ncbi:9591_t:CDS:10, partial [Cetraspora pellucida]
MSTAVLKSKTKKAINKPSRKGKKAWRKNVDITEVEEALERIRDEERILGDKLNDIPTEKLFSVDVTGDHKVKKRLDKKFAKLRIDQVLENRSKIPEVLSKPRPNYGKNHASKYTKMMLEKLAGKKHLGENSNNTDSSEDIMKTGEYDVWAQDNFSHSVKERKIKPPPTLNMKPAANIPAIHLPHCGSSYMPSFKEHQLLMIAHEEEVVKLKQMQHINSKLPYPLDASSALNIGNMIEEHDEKSSEEDDVESEETKEKAVQTKFERLPETLKTVEDEYAEHEKMMIEWTKLAEEVKKMPKKKIGKYRVRKAPIDVKLTEDLEGTLRLLKPEGNLFRDRMISYEERNIVEPRVPVSKKRKYKLK